MEVRETDGGRGTVGAVGADMTGGTTRIVRRTPAGRVAEEESRTGLADPLARGGTSSVAVAAPGTWFDGGRRGAREHETLLRALRGLPGVSVVAVDRLLCLAVAAAWRDGRATSGRYLVCDVHADATGLAVCEVSETGVRPLESAADLPFGADAFERALAAATGVPASAQAAMRERGASRAETVLGRAWGGTRFEDATVYTDHGGQVTVAQLRTAFAPFAAHLLRETAALARAVPGLRLPAEQVVTAGTLGAFPLVRQAVTDALGPAGPGHEGRTQVLEPGAAALGALLIAEGRIGCVDDRIARVGLLAHRLTADGLREIAVPLAGPDLRPAAPFAEVEGSSLVVEATPYGTGRPLLVVTDPAGGSRRLTPPEVRPGAGPYHVAFLPAWHGRGTLVLAPAGGGPSHMYPVSTGGT
ncbi:hypothetical protein [Streptosporangium sp. NPDC051022]|uniref:hypothetical protein n=1 Tax=Streptosporangium sp. NPDC051022 TaxID=3155752 RepID=UPI0034433A36